MDKDFIKRAVQLFLLFLFIVFTVDFVIFMVRGTVFLVVYFFIILAMLVIK